MTLEGHQQIIAARIREHPDLGALNIIVEADVPDVQSAVQSALAKGLQCVVVAVGGGASESGDEGEQALVLSEKFIITVGQVPGLATPTLSPVKIIDRLIPWMHYHLWGDETGGGAYVVASHAPLDGEAGVSGHQLVLRTRVPVLT